MPARGKIIKKERENYQKGDAKSSKMRSLFARQPFLALPREEAPRPVKHAGRNETSKF
jgi:hypothetical protein